MEEKYSGSVDTGCYEDGIFAKRPHVQRRLTLEIANGLKSALHVEDVDVHLQAEHLCVSSRGIKNTNSSASTSHFGGRFKITEI